MENKKNVLVVGANSYIGKNFIDYVNSSGIYNVRAISVRDDAWQTHDFSQYDVLYYVAGIAHIKETDENRDLYYRVNRDLAIAVAKKAKAEGVRQFIYMSTMSVYGMVVGHIDADTPTNPVNAYGKSKLEAEHALMELADDSFTVAAIRPPMVYGEGCKGNYQLLKKFALKVGFFPNYRNHRSMISIDRLSAATRMIIEECQTKVYMPQDSDYVCTYEMVRSIGVENGKKIHTIYGFNWLISLLTKRINVFKKVFGSLTYDKSLNVIIDGERKSLEPGLVSIVMPMYNAEKFVAEAIDSVIAQTYENWELIVVNDGSTDASPAIVESYSSRDARINKIDKTNSGIADTRNAGIEAARGQYIAFLDSDDKWLPEKLEAQLQLLKAKKGVFCFSATAFMDADSNMLDYSWPVPEVVDYKKLLHANVIPCSSVLIDRTHLSPFKMPSQGHEDYATWLTILRDNCIKAYGINEPLFVYRKSGSGASSSKFKTLSWTWHVYHDSQGFGWFMSTFCFLRFEWLTVLKYLRK